MYKTRLKIGEFSHLMQVTVKTLRHYELKGLLMPYEVDEWTGYRYYSIDQVRRLSDIRQLQALGFSLDEIRDIFSSHDQAPSVEAIEEKLRTTEQQLQQLDQRRQKLLNMRDSRKKQNSMNNNLTIQTLPEIIVASHREVIPDYTALPSLCYEKIGPAMNQLGCKCSQPGYCFTIDHNTEYTPQNIDIEYCEQVEEMLPDTDFIQFRRLPAVPKALCLTHVGPYDRFYESFTLAMHYIEENGMTIAGKARYSYIDGPWNQDDPEKWVSLIQIPVE